MATVTRVVFALLVGMVAMTTSVEARCRVSPQFWCDTYEIAEQCGVLEQCNNFLTSTSDKPVEVGLYYESLCPGCREMISSQLYPAFLNVSKIMNISLYPYGNAREEKTADGWKFFCQHGESECRGNLIEVCAMDQLKTANVYFPFIHCFEQNIDVGQVEQAAAKCAEQLRIDFAPILACSKSSKGNALEHKVALATDALSPAHQYVPWFTINRVHTKSLQSAAETDLIKLVCDTYTGSPKPAVCYRATKKSFKEF